METEDLICASETRQCKVVFHNVVNDRETLFGGEVLKWMDEVAYITATRFTRQHMVTLNIEKVDFMKPVPFGTIVELVGKVTKADCLRLDIQVSVFVEQMHGHGREKAVEGSFAFVAVNERLKAIRLELHHQ